jgi:hypothetical protein
MKRNSQGSQRRKQTIRLWSHPEARAAAPYVKSVLTSLREHRLDARRYGAETRKLADLPGRPDRTRILANAAAAKETQEAEDRFQEALEELQGLDIYLLDPVAGLALIPFVNEQQLAWFVFDLFDEEPLRSWRYHTDPLEKRRPIAEAAGPEGATLVA